MVDEAEYAAFVTERWSALVRAAVFLGAMPHEAEDLAQATLLKCYRQWELVAKADDREGYVYRMLLNTLRSERRTAWYRKRSHAEARDQPVADGTEAAAVADAVHRALGTLTKEQRDVVVLRYFVQLSEAQTASVLAVPAGTVKSRLARALAKLSASHHLADVSGGMS
jgi:RNA polymerase sigma-70 factor (sigma-E family)